MKLLVIIFVIKLLAHNKFFKYIKGKYGQHAMRQCRLLEKIIIRRAKVRCDIKINQDQYKHETSRHYFCYKTFSS